MIPSSQEGFEPGKYLSILIRSYNPNQYGALLENRLRTIFAFFGVMLAVTAILFSVVTLALTVRYIGDLPEILSPVQELRFSGDAVADAPVILVDRPSIVLDVTTNSSQTTATQHPDLLFTTGGVTYPRYLYAGTSFIPWSDVNDLKQESPLRDHLIGGLVLFLAPSIIFWGLAYFLGKVFLLSIVLLLLGYWVPRLFKSRIGAKENLKLLLLALPSALLFGVGLAPLAPGPLFWWGVALTVLLYGLGVALASDRHDDWSRRHEKRRA